jgi:surface polysaccharide O-acyltransferase-like enzyme
MSGASAGRNSVIEVLRLIAMFAIVLSHYSVHGGMSLVPGISRSTLTIAVGESFGLFGVDIFVLITGYFLSSNVSASKTIKHAVSFYAQVWTTSILCLLVAAAYSSSTVGTKDIINECLPLGRNVWWFATTYFLLLMASPFINVLIQNLSKRKHAEMIVLMLLFWSILGVIPHISYGGSDLSLFVMIYVIGSYMRRYVAAGSAGKWITGCVCLLFIMMCCTILAQVLSVRFAILLGEKLRFVEKSSPLTIAAAITALMAALSMRPRHSAVINRLASGAFGIYLFTDCPLIRPILWTNIVHTQTQFYSKALPVLMIGSVFCVFFAALAVEMLRQVIIQKPVMLLIESTIYKAEFVSYVKRHLSRDGWRTPLIP